MRVGLLSVALFMVWVCLGCLGEVTCVDRDGDGFTPCGEKADCNDWDPSIHPYADEILCDDIDQDCNGSLVENLSLTFYGPYNDGELFHRSPLWLHASQAVEVVDVTFELKSPSGDLVDGSVFHDSEREEWYFVPQFPLEPAAEYRVAATAGCEPYRIEMSFSTSEAGLPIEPGTVDGAVYSLHFDGSFDPFPWDDLPGGLAEVLGVVPPGIRVQFVDEANGIMGILAGEILPVGSGSWYQNICVPTKSWDGMMGHDPAAVWDNPVFETSASDLSFEYADVGMPGMAYEARLGGTFSVTGETIEGAWIDMATDVDLLTAASIANWNYCVFLDGYWALPCEPCPGYPERNCAFVALGARGERVDINYQHPYTGEPMTTMVEVTQEQVDAWTAAGICPLEVAPVWPSAELSYEINAWGADGPPSTIQMNVTVTAASTELCSAELLFDAAFTYGTGQGSDFWEPIDEVLTWTAFDVVANDCEGIHALYADDPVAEHLWNLHPMAFVSCDQVAADPELGSTLLATVDGIGADTFDQWCDDMNWLNPDLDVGSIEALWLASVDDGSLEEYGAFTYFAPADTANVQAWALQGVLAADAEFSAEPVEGLEGRYYAIPLWFPELW